MSRKVINIFQSFTFNQTAKKMLWLLLAADFAFVLMHVVIVVYSRLINTSFSLDTPMSLEFDHGYSEIFQYIKEYWIALILVFVAVRTTSVLCLSWAGLFFYMLLDDAGEIRARFANFASLQYNLPTVLGVQPIDLVELLVSVLVGLSFLVLIAVSYRFSSAFSRSLSKQLTILLLTLAAFGVIVDTLHSVLKNTSLNHLFIVIEDGGEMLVMSLITCYVFSILESSQLHLANLKKAESRLASSARKAVLREH